MEPSSADHDRNVISAAAMLLADRVREAVEQEAGAHGASSAALTALVAWAHGQPVQALADGLGVSHSRAVRVTDRLERDGLVERRPGVADARQSLVFLTPSGRRVARRMLRARARALDGVLDGMPPEHRDLLAQISRGVLFRAAADRKTARLICRMCDATACGHVAGHCPATAGADAHDSATGTSSA